MTAIKAIAPVLMFIALAAPIITGYRRDKLGTSIRIGWGLLIFSSFSADILIPTITGLIYGRKAELEITPNTPGTVGMVMVGWLFPLILHYVGFISFKVVDALLGLLSNARRH
jgi:Na+/serine symporter